jgi:hypothetical protein
LGGAELSSLVPVDESEPAEGAGVVGIKLEEIPTLDLRGREIPGSDTPIDPLRETRGTFGAGASR